MTASEAGRLSTIDELTGQNRRSPSNDIETELVQLRMAQGKKLAEARAGETPARPETQDLFAGTQGLPEVDGSELSGQTLAAGILHHGGLLVRNLYRPEHLKKLAQVTATEEEANRKGFGSMSCTPHTLFELLEIYQDSGLLPAIREYLNGEPLLLADRAKLRHYHVKTDAYAAIPWHQDVNFFGPKTFGVNCWAAVTSCGEDNPGLALVPHRTEERFAWREEDGLAPLDYSTKKAQGLFDPLLEAHPPAYPVLQPGDALLFDEMTVHRTASRPWTVDEQIVTVSWFFRASGFPDWGTPLAV